MKWRIFDTLTYVSIAVSEEDVNDVVSSFFILLSRESGGGTMHRINPDSLRSCLCFQVFRLNFASGFFNLLLIGFLRAEINCREASYPRTQPRGLGES